MGVTKLVRQALADVGLEGAVKTSGAKGLHVFVPIDTEETTIEAAAAATRAIAARTEQLDPTIATTAFIKDDRGGKVFVDSTRVGGATVVAPYSPRARPGVPVSFPLRWDDLDAVQPSDFTIHTALDHLGDSDPWAALMPEPQRLTQRARRRGQRHPREPCAGDARGQAAGSGAQGFPGRSRSRVARCKQTFDNGSVGFNNPDWTWSELEAALSDRGGDTDPWERGDPRARARGRDGRAPVTVVERRR